MLRLQLNLTMFYILMEVKTQASTSSTAEVVTTNDITSSVASVVTTPIQIAYNYMNSGSDWTGTCSEGLNQSPIDVFVARGVCDNSMVLDVTYDNTAKPVSIVREANTIASYGVYSNLYATNVNGELFGYTGESFHFHAPSEHTIDTQQYDLEMQIVHKLKSDFTNEITIAVLSILFEISSTDNPFFSVYQFSPLTGVPVNINFAELLGAQLDAAPVYYTYNGSLTNPPCDEIVNWYVLDQVLPISQNQLNGFNQYFSSNLTFANGNGNNRPIQEPNLRLLKKGGIVCQEQFVYFFSFFILYIFINYFIFKLL